MSRVYQTPRPTSPPVVPILLPPSLAHAWPRWQCVLFLSVDEDFPCPTTTDLLGDWSLTELSCFSLLQRKISSVGYSA